MAPRRSVRETARAKVNLALHVVGRRADGYHLLESLVAFPEISDRIEVTAADALSLAVEGRFKSAVPVSDDNLVLAAAHALNRHLQGPPRGALIQLTKTLPVASGIGGGSADAAATLRALARLWDLALTPAGLARIGADIGADVPMCVHQRPLKAEGIGEILTFLDPLPSAGIVLANPGRPIATPEVFRALSSRDNPPLAPVPASFADLDALVAYLDGERNDLEAPARSLVPEISEVLSALGETAGCRIARMSGSGATCFGLFADVAEAAEAADALVAGHPGWWVAAGRL